MTTPSPAPLLVLVAMPEEAAPLEARLQDAEELPTPFTPSVTEAGMREVRAVRGTLAGRPAVVVTSGIGIAAASAAATWAILEHRPAGVVAAGSCGGLAADVEVGTLIVGDSFTWSIADATAFGYEPGQVPGSPARFEADTSWTDAAELAARTAAVEQDALRATDARGAGAAGTTAVRRGLMLSGDAFVTAPLAQPMRERFPGALSADMETTASARTAASLGVPFVALRAVSDLCGPAADQQFHLELDLVAEISARAVEQFAGQLPAAT